MLVGQAVGMNYAERGVARERYCLSYVWGRVGLHGGGGGLVWMVSGVEWLGCIVGVEGMIRGGLSGIGVRVCGARGIGVMLVCLLCGVGGGGWLGGWSGGC